MRGVWQISVHFEVRLEPTHEHIVKGFHSLGVLTHQFGRAIIASQIRISGSHKSSTALALIDQLVVDS